MRHYVGRTAQQQFSLSSVPVRTEIRPVFARQQPFFSSLMADHIADAAGMLPGRLPAPGAHRHQ
ncbi:MAG: hypothetical protein GX916_08330 [Clostridiales bacterium]|nr:hypothetical protein [Clostridiales bacterium]